MESTRCAGPSSFTSRPRPSVKVNAAGDSVPAACGAQATRSTISKEQSKVLRTIFFTFHRLKYKTPANDRGDRGSVSVPSTTYFPRGCGEPTRAGDLTHNPTANSQLRDSV